MSRTEEFEDLEDTHAALLTEQMVSALRETPDHAAAVEAAKRLYRAARTRFLAQHAGPRGAQAVFEHLQRLETVHASLVRAELVALLSATAATEAEEAAAWERYKARREEFFWFLGPEAAPEERRSP